jgi:hypothetical protein
VTDPTHGPIEEAQRDMMNVIASALDDVFNPNKDKKEISFLLLTARFGDIKDGRVNYISNADREDTISMMKEIIARFEGRYAPESGNA